MVQNSVQKPLTIFIRNNRFIDLLYIYILQIQKYF